MYAIVNSFTNGISVYSNSQRTVLEQQQLLVLWANQLLHVLYIDNSVYTCALCVAHEAHGKFDRMNWRSSKRCRDDAVLSSAYPVQGSASKVNRLGADAQVVSCHRYLIVFHPFVEQLTIFHTSGLVLASPSILRVLDLDLHRDCIMSSTCQRGT